MIRLIAMSQTKQNENKKKRKRDDDDGPRATRIKQEDVDRLVFGMRLANRAAGYSSSKKEHVRDRDDVKKWGTLNAIPACARCSPISTYNP